MKPNQTDASAPSRRKLRVRACMHAWSRLLACRGDPIMGDGLGPHVGRAGLTLTDHHRRRNGADVLSSTANARARGQIALLQHFTILFEFRHVPYGLSNDDRLPLHLRIYQSGTCFTFSESWMLRYLFVQLIPTTCTTLASS